MEWSTEQQRPRHLRVVALSAIELARFVHFSKSSPSCPYSSSASSILLLFPLSRLPRRQRYGNPNRRPTRRKFLRNHLRKSHRGVRHRSLRLPNPRRRRSSHLHSRFLRIGIRKTNSRKRPNKDLHRTLCHARNPRRRRRFLRRRQSIDGRRLVHERRRAR